MPTVAELSAPYGNFMLGPRRGPSVCSACFNLTDGWGRCRACASCESWLDAVAPISYSVAGEQLHHALVSYKRLVGAGGRHFTMGLAAVLWRYLAAHEACLARAAGTESFAVVTTVPSSDVERDPSHPLSALVSELVGPVRARYVRALGRSPAEVAPHRFCAQRYAPLHEVAGRHGAADRRHVDDGRQCAERRRGAEGGGRERSGGRGDRTARQPRLAPQRSPSQPAAPAL